MDYAYKIYKITHRKICLRCCRVNVFNNEYNREKDENGIAAKTCEEDPAVA